jgi:DNA replication protein DnaC
MSTAIQPMQGSGMNQMMEIFKMQYLMKFMDSPGKSAQSSMFTMLILMAYDHFSKGFPMLLVAFWSWFMNQYGPKLGITQPKIFDIPANPVPPPMKSVKAFIQFERAADQKVIDPRIDAVLYHVCNLPDVRSLRFNGIEMIPNFKDMLMIDNDIWFEILTPGSSPSVQGSQVKIEPILYKLATYDHDITWLHRFVEDSINRYDQDKKNKLGSEIYYFDQIVSNSGPFSNPISKSFCSFKKSKFFSNRTLDNVYLRQIEELQNRVEFFLKRRDWYDSKGIPHTLGIVMYGHPGCGKTSTIKAIANETKRHIFNIMLSEIKTKESLKELFYNDVVHINNDGKLEILNIPVKQRLYVIEDIDAMESVVIKRTDEQIRRDEEKRLKREAEMELLKQNQGLQTTNRMLDGREDSDTDKLDLATLLNVLDGVRETPGRIIILSTNYPERLDEALLRPGRFDIMVEFEKHGVSVLKQHIEKYYDITLSEKQWAILNTKSLEHKWTPAEVSQILFRNLQNPDQAIRELYLEDPKKIFKFSQMKEAEPIEKCTFIEGLQTIEESEMISETRSESRSELNSENENQSELKLINLEIIESKKEEETLETKQPTAAEEMALDTFFNMPHISRSNESIETLRKKMLGTESLDEAYKNLELMEDNNNRFFQALKSVNMIDKHSTIEEGYEVIL